jgi:hypothetical protein
MQNTITFDEYPFREDNGQSGVQEISLIAVKSKTHFVL